MSDKTRSVLVAGAPVIRVRVAVARRLLKDAWPVRALTRDQMAKRRACWHTLVVKSCAAISKIHARSSMSAGP